MKSRAVAQMLNECRSTSQAAPTFPSTAPGGDKGDDAATLDKLQKKTLGSFFKKSYTESVATSDLTEQQVIEAELNRFLQAPDSDSETISLSW